jgi:hypothetical protein
LTRLDLHNTKVTDAGLKELVALVNLSELTLWDTKVTDEGAQALRSALPKCHIHR